MVGATAAVFRHPSAEFGHGYYGYVVHLRAQVLVKGRQSTGDGGHELWHAPFLRPLLDVGVPPAEVYTGDLKPQFRFGEQGDLGESPPELVFGIRRPARGPVVGRVELREQVYGLESGRGLARQSLKQALILGWELVE